MKQYLEALKNREEVSQAVLEELEERFKEPEPEPVIPEPTEYEVLRDYVLDLDIRVIMMELGL